MRIFGEEVFPNAHSVAPFPGQDPCGQGFEEPPRRIRLHSAR